MSSIFFPSKEKKALNEYAKRLTVQEFQSKAETWLTKRFMEDDKLLYWDKYGYYDEHIWDGTPNPFATAFEALSNKEWVGIKSATAVGKTYFLPRVIMWFLDTYPNSLVVTTAPKKEQLRRVLWTEIANAFPKFKRIRPFAEMNLLNLTVDTRTRKLIMKRGNSEVDLKDTGLGHEAIGVVAGVGSGEDSATKMQGYHRENMLFVIEECAGVHEAVITAIVNTCTGNNNLILAVGNPDSELDALSVFCGLNKTREIVISALDHPNIKAKMELIPGAVTQQSIDFRREEYGEDSPFYKSRIRGIAPTEGTDSLIKSDYLEQCLINSEKFISEVKEVSYNAVGVDVSNSEEGDKACVAYGKGNLLDYIKEFHCNNATHLAYNLIYDDVYCESKGYKVFGIPKVQDYVILNQNIGVDGVGIGVATVNALYDAGYQCVSLVGGQLDYAIRTGTQGEDLYKFSSLRAQMYFEAREDLRTASIVIGITDKRIIRQLKKELVTVKYSIKGGKIYVESKEEIKKKLGGKSPNLADAFVYWNWIRKGYYNNTNYLPFQ